MLPLRVYRSPVGVVGDPVVADLHAAATLTTFSGGGVAVLRMCSCLSLFGSARVSVGTQVTWSGVPDSRTVSMPAV